MGEISDFPSPWCCWRKFASATQFESLLVEMQEMEGQDFIKEYFKQVLCQCFAFFHPHTAIDCFPDVAENTMDTLKESQHSSAFILTVENA